MTEGQKPAGQAPAHAGADQAFEADTISLRPIVDLLVAYRLVIGAAVAVAVLLSLVTLLSAVLYQPVERTATVKFRLLFSGAADNLYPNGTTFSPAEIIATPVLSEVYRANELKPFGGYDDFKDSMAILQSSFERDLLASSYSARLADTKLTPVDRVRIEDEFRKTRDAIKDPVFSLTLRRTERLKAMPATLVEKVLNDTLTTWARQADELKGATRFDVPVFSRNLLKEDILAKDFMIAADDLRVQARRAAHIAEQLLLVPGAATLRSAKDGVSLSEVNFTIADILRNQIEPVVYLIQERGLTNDAQAIVRYLHGHVVQLRLERDAARARIQVLQDALQNYMAAKGARTPQNASSAGATGRPSTGLDTQTLIPQVSESFLNRLMEMSSESQASDLLYRQRLTDRVIKEGEALAELTRSTTYYEGLEQAVRSGGKATPEQAEAVKAQLRTAFNAISAAVERLVLLYDELSEQRLNPSAVLYSVTEPFSLQTHRALTWKTVLQLVAGAGLLALILAPIGCAIHQAARRRPGLTRSNT